MVSLREGFGVGFRGVAGGRVSCANNRKWERGVAGGGGGVGTGKGTGKSVRKLCRNYPLAIYPLVSPLRLLNTLNNMRLGAWRSVFLGDS